jgi:hypothetical protein
LRERAVDVAEAEEAEIVGANANSLARGLKPRSVYDANAALKRRASTVLQGRALVQAPEPNG